MSARYEWRAAAVSLIAGLALLCTGCASLAPAGGATADTEINAGQQIQRVYRPNIALEGRLSLRYQQNNQNQSVHGNFIWTQIGEKIALHLLSPLGQTIAVIDIKPGLATLTQSGKTPRAAADADQLTAQTLGWPLPIAGLREWLQGFATDAGGKPFIAKAGNGNDSDAATAVTTRDGWRIQYVNWQATTASDGNNVPKRIDLERYTKEAGEVAIRIVIDKAS